jgi:hypothetical protein
MYKECSCYTRVVVSVNCEFIAILELHWTLNLFEFDPLSTIIFFLKILGHDSVCV